MAWTAATRGDYVRPSGSYASAMTVREWALVAPLPEPFKKPPGPGWFLNFAFDPVNNVFYASWMGKPLYRFER